MEKGSTWEKTENLGMVHIIRRIIFQGASWIRKKKRGEGSITRRRKWSSIRPQNMKILKPVLLTLYDTFNTLYTLQEGSYAKKFLKKLQLNYFNDHRHGGGGADQCLS